jgi:parallel beta-helix repeat protein
MRRICVGLFLVFVVSGLAAPALAGEGRIPIWQPVSITPGMEGKYVLTRDVSAVGGSGLPAIDIQPGTVAVDIDLNGFTLYGVDTDVILAVGVDSLTIRNGTIMFGLGDGISVLDARKVVIEDVKIEFVHGYGIHLTGVTNFAVRRNILVSDPDADPGMIGGIWVDGTQAPGPVEGKIEDNQIDSAGFGIQVDVGSAVTIRGNQVEDALQGDGIHVLVCDGCLIAENTVQHSAGIGIVLTDANVNKVYNNVVFGASDGIALLGNTSDCLVLDNNSSQNQPGSGLVVSGFRNQINGNVFNFNASAGIWFMPSAAPTNNTFGRNVMRSNAAIPAGSIGCPFTPLPCTFPDVCDDAGGNSSFTDNMGPVPGC